MRLSTLYSWVLYVAFLVFLGSCASVSTSIQVMVPAQIDVPSHIKTVVIANRSMPEKKQKAWNILEGFVSGESIFADRDGSFNCVKGLVDKLNNTQRFQASFLSEQHELRGTGTRVLPEPLIWSDVELYCKQNNADALIVLETFDSNLLIDSKRIELRHDENSKEAVEIHYKSILAINVNSQWRIYDVIKHAIVDQSNFNDEKEWQSDGLSPEEALRKQPSKRTAINESGYFAGQQYGKRISPGWVNTTRSYFVKGHDDFKKAKRFVHENDWKGAAKIWKTLTTNTDEKIAGRACYNMALACEMEGSLDIALEWANRAYKENNISSARTYIDIIRSRIRDNERLDNQLK